MELDNKKTDTIFRKTFPGPGKYQVKDINIKTIVKTETQRFTFWSSSWLQGGWGPSRLRAPPRSFVATGGERCFVIIFLHFAQSCAWNPTNSPWTSFSLQIWVRRSLPRWSPPCLGWSLALRPETKQIEVIYDLLFIIYYLSFIIYHSSFIIYHLLLAGDLADWGWSHS